jgi:hypothetical protein
LETIIDKLIWHDGSPVKVSGYELINCEFQGHVRRNPKGENQFSDMVIRNARTLNNSIDAAIISNVEVVNLKRFGRAPLFLTACLFDRVKVAGSVSGVKINPAPIGCPDADLPFWHERATTFYANCDYALDIREANFVGEVTFEAVPGDLVIRDPKRQILVSHAADKRELLDAIAFEYPTMRMTLSWYLENPIFPSLVVAARHEKKQRDAMLADFERLRAVGIAEAD